MKRCQKCNGLMPDDVTRCIRCGHDAAPKTPASSAPKAVTPPAAVQPGAGRIRNGWALAKQSWRVLRLDKELLVFPLASGVSCLLVLAGFVAGLWAGGAGERNDWTGETTGWALLFVYYFANYFVIVFFNSALVACAMIRFRGGDPTVRDGLRAARERIAQIAAWALLAATVGVVLRMIESRSKLVGRIVTALLGAAWTLGTYFVVPVLVVEKLGPVDALKRSIAIARKAWGESIVSNAAVGLTAVVATLALVIPVGVVTVVLAVKASSLAIALAGAAVIALLMVLGALVGSALSSIALSALYLYATQGKVPAAFEGAGVQHAFASR